MSASPRCLCLGQRPMTIGDAVAVAAGLQRPGMTAMTARGGLWNSTMTLLRISPVERPRLCLDCIWDDGSIMAGKMLVEGEGLGEESNTCRKSCRKAWLIVLQCHHKTRTRGSPRGLTRPFNLEVHD
jgi:hypothetical protein